MKVIRITIQTEPVAKSRARTVFSGNKIRTYTPQKTVDAQDFIRARLLRHRKDAFPAHIPIKLSATFYRTKSKYLPKRETMPYRKSDLDNYCKTLLDSINGILVPDDAQFTTLNIRKRWSPTGVGYITIKMEEDNDNQ